MTSLHHRQGVFLVLLDLSAAFDTVSHSILFQRMQQELGIRGTALKWVKSYFSGRTTSVCINGCHSTKSSLNYGLPQGSIVGPVSFSIYTIPIGRIIRKHRLSYHLYADDVQLYTSFDPSSQSSIDHALSSLALCISDIQSWMMCNMLQLNREKIEFFVAASSHIKNQMPAVKLQVGNETIEPSEKVRNLGVIFDTSMTMCNQISCLSRNITFHLRNISRIRRFLDFDSCNDIIRSLILSRLDYGNVLLLGANSTDISRLQTLQNWAAKLIFCASKKNHASPLLRQLHWLPVRDRITFKVMLYVLNALPALDQSIYHRAWNCTILLARAYDLPLMPHDWLCQSSAVGLSNLLLTRHLLTPLPTFGTSCRLLCAVLNQCLFSKRDSNLICFPQM